MAGNQDNRSHGQLLQEIGALRAELAALRARPLAPEVEEELQRARRSAEEAGQAKDQFIAVLSHELRTPLTPVLVTAATLENDPRLPADLQPAVRLIRRNVQLEARLVDDLLDLTGIGSGSLQLQLEAADAHAIAAEAVEVSRPHIELKKQSARLDLSASKPHVWADPVRFQHAIWNLIINAVKFTPDGGEITVRSRNEGDRLVVEVSDNGIGIESKYLDRIFDAFDQGDPAVGRRYGGVGLGLTISRTLIDAHGGKLTARSDGKGRGTTFTITVPVVERADNGRTAKTSSGKKRPLRILLVEDHSDTRLVLARLLRSYGYYVTIAGDVKSALQEAEAAQFDLLVSDIGLPDGSGWDLVRQVLAMQPIKAIALSGYGTEADLERSRASGFNIHVTKPIDPRKLGEVIERVTQ